MSVNELEWCSKYLPGVDLNIAYKTYLYLGKDFCKIYPNDRLMLDGLSLECDIADGARTKIWYTDGVNRLLYKRSKLHTDSCYNYEHVSEYLAMLIGKALGVPVVDISMSDCAVLSRVMSFAALHSFVEYSDEFSHSFHLGNLQTFNISTLLNPNNNKYWRDTIVMLLFDVLIGNFDRHPGNFVYSDEYGFYPLFDNGSSLLCYVKDKDVPSILRDGNRFKSINTTKSKPVLRDNGKLTHLELLLILKKQHPVLVSDFAEKVVSLDSNAIVSKVRMSDAHKELVIQFLEYRKKWFEV